MYTVYLDHIQAPPPLSSSLWVILTHLPPTSCPPFLFCFLKNNPLSLVSAAHKHVGLRSFTESLATSLAVATPPKNKWFSFRSTSQLLTALQLGLEPWDLSPGCGRTRSSPAALRSAVINPDWCVFQQLLCNTFSPNTRACKHVLPHRFWGLRRESVLVGPP